MRVIKNGEILGDESLMRDICAFSANLKDKNLPCVEIYLSSSYDFIVALFGAINAGIKAYILPKEAHLGLGVLINDNNFVEFLGDSRDFKSDSRVDFGESKGESDADSSDSRNFCGANLADLFSESALDLPFFLSTSGSSKDKGDIIPKTARQMICEAQILCETLGANENDTFIASATHQHLYGLTHKIFLPLIAKATILDNDLKFPELILEYCAQSLRESIESKGDSRDDLHQNLCHDSHTKNLILITSPTLLKYLSKQPNLRPLSALKAIISAGAKLESAIRTHFREAINLDIFEVYGSTESGIVAFNAHFSNQLMPFRGVNLRVDSDSRLIIRSLWSVNALMRGDFISNDSAKIENGALILQGRIDRIVKFFERRVSLDSLEAQIRTLAIIEDCFVGVVAGQNHAHCIIVLSEKGKELFLQSGKKGIVETIKTLKIKEIRHFHIRAKLPYNNQGKITKKDFIACVGEKIVPRFEIIRAERDLLNARSYVDEGSFYFDGHFANFPLVPGFVELSFVVWLAKTHLNLGENFNVESVKFISFLRPFSEVEVQMERKNNKIYFQILSNKKECANGRISPKN